MGTENEKPPTKRRRKDSYSQAVLNRIRLANDLRSSLDVHETKIADRWEDLLSPYLEDGERLELTTLVRATDRLIANRLRRLEESEEEHRLELDQDSVLREERRHWAGELRRRLVDLRQSAKSLYGKAVAEKFLGLSGRTPRNLVELRRVGQRVVNRISDPERDRPETRHPGTELEWDWWKEQVEIPLRELEAADRAVSTDEGETDTALEQKRLDLESYDQQVHAVARWLMATYELIDFEPARRSLLPETRGRRRTGKRRSSGEESPESSEARSPAEEPNRAESSA